jgi:probable F420-dependent oxidoreductase
VKIGLFGINFGPAAQPEALVRIARAAEEAGLDSLWTGEHVVLPDPRVPPSPSEPRTPFLDPAVALALAAAHTRRIRLATGVIILPQRNPLVLAKELASLDVVSNGRLVFGLGAGYLEPEFRALGAPFEERGAVTDEAIQVIRALWTLEKPAFRGRFWSFQGIDAHPRPVQKPHPPIVVGGMSRLGARRAARFGNGWYGFLTDLEATRRSTGWLAEAVSRGERPAALGPVEITVTPPPPLTRDAVRRYEDLGVHRLVALAAGASDAEGMLRYVDELGALQAG